MPLRHDSSLPTSVRPSPRSKTGVHVGPYVVAELIARGSTSRVYRGVHRERGLSVAIKFLHDHLFDNQTVVDRFYDEADTAVGLSASGLAAVLDHGTDEHGSAFIVMEMVEGVTLADLLARRGPLPPGDVVDLGLQLARTLTRLHEAGIVHRDLKPANIGLEPDDTRACGYRAVIFDLGLAKRITPASRRARTATGCILGTPRYMAPEQYANASSADPRSDIYALGCVLYHAATGRAPFVGDAMEEARAHRDDQPAPAHERRAELPVAISQLVDYMLAKSPDLRPQSMLEVCRLFLSSSEERWLPRLAAGSFTDVHYGDVWDDVETITD